MPVIWNAFCGASRSRWQEDACDVMVTADALWTATMVTAPARALCAGFMLQVVGLPLARAFCSSAPRPGGAYRGGPAALALQQQVSSSSSSSNSRSSSSSDRVAARRPAGRLCMSTDASPAAEKAPAGMEEEVDPGEVAGLRILKYPHPALRAENEEIEVFDDDVKKLARDMFKIMYAAKGVGLAAPQVGVNKRLMVFNPEGDAKNWLDEAILVNPKIVASGKGRITAEEGCLSFPGMEGKVERRNWVKVEAVNAKGKKVKKKYTDWTARIFQHEYDHLDGTVYIDHLSPPEREKVQPVLDKLVSDFGEEGAL